MKCLCCVTVNVFELQISITFFVTPIQIQHAQIDSDLNDSKKEDSSSILDSAQHWNAGTCVDGCLYVCQKTPERKKKKTFSLLQGHEAVESRWMICTPSIFVKWLIQSCSFFSSLCRLSVADLLLSLHAATNVSFTEAAGLELSVCKHYLCSKCR